MKGLTLLEKFRAIEGKGEALKAGVKSPRERLVFSILRHLKKLLNTNQGSVQIAEDYGIPDLTNFPAEGFLDTVDELERIIKNTIEKYEPRLRGVTVKKELSDESNQMNIKFKIQAEALIDVDKSVPVSFETVISTKGIEIFERH